jgi:hypothetical protein
MFTTFDLPTTPVTDGNRNRVQGNHAPRWCAGTSVQPNTTFATVFAATFFCALFLLIGCSRGPSYNEALQRYTAEQQELTRLQVAQQANLDKLTEIHQERAETEAKLAASGASGETLAKAREKLDAADKQATDELVAEGDVLSKKIAEQQKRVADAEALKNSLQP